MSRVCSESVTKKGLRLKRFRNILTDLALAHEAFNEVQESRKATLMIEEIIPRYICALDVALMDCAYK